MEWKLADAKNKFSEVVRRALSEGPQRVLRRGDAVVVISEEEFEALRGRRRDFLDFLKSGPDISGLDLSRDASAMRDAPL